MNTALWLLCNDILFRPAKVEPDTFLSTARRPSGRLAAVLLLLVFFMCQNTPAVLFFITLVNPKVMNVNAMSLDFRDTPYQCVNANPHAWGL